MKKTDHYNLYYIFKEDKEKNHLSQSKAAFLWKRMPFKKRATKNHPKP